MLGQSNSLKYDHDDQNVPAYRTLWGDEPESSASRWRSKPEVKNKELSLEGKIAYRQKQIDFGKNTIGYDNYIKAVPKHRRQKRNPKHPQTPDKGAHMSTKRFASHLKIWRKSLHQYDHVKSTKQTSIVDRDECVMARAAEVVSLAQENVVDDEILTVATPLVDTDYQNEIIPMGHTLGEDAEEDHEVVPMCMLPDFDDFDEDGNLVEDNKENSVSMSNDTVAKQDSSDDMANAITCSIKKSGDFHCVYTSSDYYVEGFEEDIY
eukprot:CFRG0672T1